MWQRSMIRIIKVRRFRSIRAREILTERSVKIVSTKSLIRTRSLFASKRYMPYFVEGGAPERGDPREEGLATLPTTPSPLGGSVIEVSDLAVSWNVVAVGAQW